MRVVPPLLACLLLAGCAGTVGDTARLAGETDVACIHRLNDYPARSQSFAAAVLACAGNRPPDLSGDRYYQLRASTENIAFVSHDRPGTDTMVVTGSRIPQSTAQPAAPQLSLH